MKEKLKKGTFSGVIPMMGLFAMAAMMGFQSIPISQAISQEMTSSYSDLSRLTKTKSFANLYFYNYVPTGTEYALNEKSYHQAKEGGNVSWGSGEFNPDTDIDIAVISKMSDIIGGELNPATEDYLNNKYGETPGSTACTVPDINYTTKIFPDSTDYKEAASNHPDKILMTVRSETEIQTTFYGFPSGVDAAPIEVECSNQQGDTKYIGDSTSSGSGGGGGGLFYFNNWQSVGYTSELNVSANRYHILARETSEFYKRLHDRWVNVGEETGHSSYTCSLGRSEKVSAVSSAVSDVDNSITSKRSTAISNLRPLPDGIEIKENNIDTFDSFLGGDVTTGKFRGSVSTTVQSGDCVCDCGEDCCNHEKRYKATATPETSKHYFSLKDTKYSIITETGWKKLNFTVSPYNHDFENDD